MGTANGFVNPNAAAVRPSPEFAAIVEATDHMRGLAAAPPAAESPTVGTTGALDAPEAAPKPAGEPQRPRKTLANSGKARSAKGAGGEREVLAALRATMENVEEDLRASGVHVVGRSENVVRKRIEKKRSKEDIGGVPIISIEVKRQENLNLKAAWEQALKQADGGRLPVLCYRCNREPWTVRTWLALTSPAGLVVRYVVGEISLPDFLAYYAEIYRRFLTEQTR